MSYAFEEAGELTRPTAHDLAHSAHEKDWDTLCFALVSSKPSTADVRLLVTESCGLVCAWGPLPVLRGCMAPILWHHKPWFSL